MDLEFGAAFLLCFFVYKEPVELKLPKMHTSFVVCRTNDKHQSPHFFWLTILSRASIPSGATAFPSGLALLSMFCLWTASLLATHRGPPAVVVHEAPLPPARSAVPEVSAGAELSATRKVLCEPELPCPPCPLSDLTGEGDSFASWTWTVAAFVLGLSLGLGAGLALGVGHWLFLKLCWGTRHDDGREAVRPQRALGAAWT